jgi:hypothetical protein
MGAMIETYEEKRFEKLKGEVSNPFKVAEAEAAERSSKERPKMGFT